MKFILASASPRRRSLLRSIGLEPEIQPQDVDESVLADEAPIAYATRVAASKARACDTDLPVLAADTIVALDGECLQKATNDALAREMLEKLSGRWHAVHTAIVLRVQDRLRVDVVTTRVRFRHLTDADITRYIETGEGKDKAGGYGIQGEGGALVAQVNGSYTNVVGLPLEQTQALLRQVERAP